MLVDGGAGLNLISPAVIKKMQIPDEDLQETGTFQGANPGRTQPKGQIVLPVTFGDPINFRTEKVVFDVVDLPQPYNGILGRPTLAKFMAASHYAYNTLKIPGPLKVITIHSDKKDAVMCVAQMYKEAAAVSAGKLPTGTNKTTGKRVPGRSTPEGSGVADNSSADAGKTSGKRATERRTPEERSDPPAVKNKKATKDAVLTKQIPSKEDGSGTFTISTNLSSK